MTKRLIAVGSVSPLVIELTISSRDARLLELGPGYGTAAGTILHLKGNAADSSTADHSDARDHILHLRYGASGRTRTRHFGETDSKESDRRQGKAARRRQAATLIRPKGWREYRLRATSDKFSKIAQA